MEDRTIAARGPTARIGEVYGIYVAGEMHTFSHG